LTIRIPPGVDTGTRIQLQGEGEVGPNGGTVGDLFVEIVVEPHPVFERNGDELHCVVAIPMAAAALGTTVELESLDGSEEIAVAPGTQAGQTITMRGKGAARLRGGGRGDLFIHVDVQVPTGLDARQQELLREFLELRGEQAVHTVQSQNSPDGGGLFGRLKDAFSSR
jgi:molecular chaperone DnaJ